MTDIPPAGEPVSRSQVRRWQATSVPAMAAAFPRTWTIEMPAGMRLLSLNDRRHWAEKGRITRDLRAAACVLARQQKIPPLERVSVVVEYQPPVLTRRRDLDNVPAASGKPCIDGALTDARVVPSDDSRHVAEITYRVGEPYPRGRIVLRISEVAADGS